MSARYVRDVSGFTQTIPTPGFPICRLDKPGRQSKKQAKHLQPEEIPAISHQMIPSGLLLFLYSNTTPSFWFVIPRECGRIIEIFFFLDIPDNPPIIQTNQERYRIGGLLLANCTSLRSSPAAQLTWTINGKSVSVVC